MTGGKKSKVGRGQEYNGDERRMMGDEEGMKDREGRKIKGIEGRRGRRRNERKEGWGR